MKKVNEMNIRQTFGYVRRELIKKGYEVTFYYQTGRGNNILITYEKPWKEFYKEMPYKLKVDEKIIDSMNMNFNEFSKTWFSTGLDILKYLNIQAENKTSCFQGDIFTMLKFLKSDVKKPSHKQKFFENNFETLCWLEGQFVKNTLEDNYKKCDNQKSLFLCQVTNQNFIDLYQIKEIENQNHAAEFKSYLQEVNDDFYRKYDYDLEKKNSELKTQNLELKTPPAPASEIQIVSKEVKQIKTKKVSKAIAKIETKEPEVNEISNIEIDENFDLNDKFENLLPLKKACLCEYCNKQPAAARVEIFEKITIAICKDCFLEIIESENNLQVSENNLQLN
jgi:hypothetical protein